MCVCVCVFTERAVFPLPPRDFYSALGQDLETLRFPQSFNLRLLYSHRTILLLRVSRNKSNNRKKDTLLKWCSHVSHAEWWSLCVSSVFLPPTVKPIRVNLKLYSDAEVDLMGLRRDQKKNPEHNCTLNWPVNHHPQTAILVYPRPFCLSLIPRDVSITPTPSIPSGEWGDIEYRNKLLTFHHSLFTHTKEWHHSVSRRK